MSFLIIILLKFYTLLFYILHFLGIVKPNKYIAKRPGCDSPYGCCEDYMSPAKGPNDYMCPRKFI